MFRQPLPLGNGGPPLKKTKVDSNGSNALNVSVSLLQSSQYQSFPDDWDDDSCLTQPDLLREIDERVAAVSRGTVVSGTVVQPVVQCREGATFSLGDLSQFGPVSNSQTPASILPPSRTNDDDSAAQKKLEDALKQLRTREGELKILRYQLAEAQREKTLLQKEITEAKTQHSLLIQDAQHALRDAEKKCQDQIHFMELEKTSIVKQYQSEKAAKKQLELEMSQVHHSDSTCSSEIDGRRADRSIDRSKKLPKFPNRKSFFNDDVATSRSRNGANLNLTNQSQSSPDESQSESSMVNEEVQTDDLNSNSNSNSNTQIQMGTIASKIRRYGISSKLMDGELLSRISSRLRQAAFPSSSSSFPSNEGPREIISLLSEETLADRVRAMLSSDE